MRPYYSSGPLSDWTILTEPCISIAPSEFNSLPIYLSLSRQSGKTFSTHQMWYIYTVRMKLFCNVRSLAASAHRFQRMEENTLPSMRHRGPCYNK